MTNKEKQLLLKDFCGRLSYNVKAEITAHNLDYEKDFGKVIIADVCGINIVKDDEGNLFPCVITCYDKYKTQGNDVESIKPYLRPMPSMTKEEEEEFKQIIEIELKYLESEFDGHTVESAASSTFEIDFYNSHHLDYRGLIPMGLALEAPEGMYDKSE